MTIFTAARRRSDNKVKDEKSPLLPTNSEDSVYEFNGASFPGAVFNLSTTIVGAGIMSLPATMKVLGVVPGVFLIILMAFLTDVSIQFILRFSKAGNDTSYGDLMGNSFGKIGKILLQVAILVNNIGVLIVYMIIIGDVLSGTSASGVHHSGIFEEWFGESWWTSRTFILLVTTLAIFSPLASIKRIDSLRYTSALSVGFAVAFLVITIGITIVKLIDGSVAMPRLFPAVSDLTSAVRLFPTIPILVTAFLCHYNVHGIQCELKDPSRMKSIARASLMLCSSVYILTSLFGFLLFGDSTLDDVLANFDADLGIPFSSALSDAVRISYAAHLVLVFPVVFYPLRACVDALLFPSSPPLYQSTWRFSLLSIALMSCIFLGANFIPSIWDAFQFTGATAAVCIGFIFPASVVLRDSPKISTAKDKILGVLMIVLAVVSNVVAVYGDALAIIRRK